MNTINNKYDEYETLDRDDKAMKDAYTKGETINDLAKNYGLSPSEVEAIVVNEVKDNGPLLTQEEIDKRENKGKE